MFVVRIEMAAATIDPMKYEELNKDVMKGRSLG
jgi:hypothetical protein